VSLIIALCAWRPGGDIVATGDRAPRVVTSQRLQMLRCPCSGCGDLRRRWPPVPATTTICRNIAGSGN